MKICVKHPDEDYWSNIVRVLKYLEVKIVLNMTLCVDGLSIIKWWVENYYAVNEDWKGHTGVMMFLDKGTITSFQENKRYKTRDPQSMSLLVHMMHFRKHFGSSILSKHRDKPWDITSYINTTKTLCYWRWMENSQSQSGKSTSRQYFFNQRNEWSRWYWS